MDKKFLLEYLNTDSPSTFEVEAQQSWIKQVTSISDEIVSDNYGNTYAKVFQKNNTSTTRYKVVIDAHCDEIGWLVKEISDEGFIRVKRNGGTDNDITPNTRIKIMTDTGKKVKGFFGWMPIHFKDKDKPTKPSEENLYVDVAATSKEEVEELGIKLGDYIVADREAEIVNDKYIVGKAVDDKVGGFILSEVLKRLKEEKIELPFDLYAVNSVQEEVGLRGAKMITDKIKPDVAICFDVCFDTNTPNISKEKHGNFKMGDGVVFRKGYDVHPYLLKLMQSVVDEKEIPYKLQVGGAGGTNTTAYNLSNAGVVSAIASIPLRGMHTQNEMVNIEDVENAIKFYIELLQKIEFNHNFKLV